MLSPILLPNEKKNERRTKGLPGFYLVETTSGVQGIVGELNPESLNRVQSAGPSTTLRQRPKLFHAIYWSELPLSDLELEGTEIRADGSHVSQIAEPSKAKLIDFFSDAVACLIGREECFEEAIAQGRSSISLALWSANDPKLPWLPCHRVIRDVDWYQSGWMVCLGREHLFFHDVTAELLEANGSGSRTESLLAPREDEVVTLLAVSKDGAWRIHSKSGWADGVLQHLHSSLREVAVVQLESILLPKALSLSPMDGSQDSRITVEHNTRRALAALNEGAQVAYLLSPIRSAKLQELVQHGQMLPANSVALDFAALESWMDAE